VGVDTGVGEGISVVGVGGGITSVQAARKVALSTDAKAIATIILGSLPLANMIQHLLSLAFLVA
jgi:hypothetical protein